MSNAKLKEELREMASKLRTKPIPLKDIIPLLQRAADAIPPDGAMVRGVDGILRRV
jgi:hypothetical protein